MRDAMQFILEKLAPYKRTVIFAMVVAVLAAGLDFVTPLLLGKAIDLAVVRAPFAMMLAVCGGWFVAGASSQLAKMYINQRGWSLVGRIEGDHTATTFARLLNKRMAFHLDKLRDEVMDATRAIASEMSNTIVALIFDILPNVLALFALAIYCVLVSWQIGVVLLVGLAAYAALAVQGGRAWLAISKTVRQKNNEANVFFSQGIRNALAIKAAAAENVVAKKLHGLIDAMVVANDDAEQYFMRGGMQLEMIARVCHGVIFAFGVYSLSMRHISYGQLAAVIGYAFSAFSYLSNLRWTSRTVIGFAGHLAIFMKLDKATDEPRGDRKKYSLRGEVAFSDVVFGYRSDAPILRGATFEIKPNEKVAIVGPTGQGKTTIVSLLGRYYDPDSGVVSFDGVDAKKIDPRMLREQIGYVAQDTFLANATLRENIALGDPDAKDEDIMNVAKLSQLDELISKLPDKLDTIVGDRGLKLSGGERQRVGIARAMLRDPKILILDEPTSNLDVHTEEKIMSALERVMQKRTTIIIAHRLNTIRSADRIIVLNDGRIAESGSHEELVKKDGLYAEMLRRAEKS